MSRRAPRLLAVAALVVSACGGGGSGETVCLPEHCSGHGTCAVEGGIAVCRCEANYEAHGLECLPGPCAGWSCSGHGTCTLASGFPTCACDPGYLPSGNDCVPDCGAGYHVEGDECVPDDPCNGVACSGHGSCLRRALSEEAFCECDDGFHPTGLACAPCDTALPAGCDAAQDPTCVDLCAAQADVAALASAAMAGRRPGTPGNEAAVAYVEQRFRALGLSQVPGLGGWRQVFSADLGGGATAQVANVVGVLPGASLELQHEVVIIGAHLDHLGTRFDGAVYPGADDDASGVAVMLELARAFATSATPPGRTLVFAAWNAEELGLLGSCHYTDEDPLLPLADTVAVFSVDMVGQGNERGLDLLGTNVDPIPQLAAVMAGAAGEAGLGFELRTAGALEGSDHVCFSYQGVPAVLAMTTPPHDGYHTPEDVPGRIGTENLRVATELVLVAAQAYAQGEEGRWTAAAARRAPAVAPAQARVTR